MDSACVVNLIGAQAAETMTALGRRVAELGRRVERIDAAFIDALGGETGVPFVANVLARNGVFALLANYGIAADDAGNAPQWLRIELSPHDEPGFAAEKVLDVIAGRNLLTLHAPALSPDEEDAMRQRLAALGYIE